MKTPLTYGFLMALGGTLVTFALFFAGFHDSAEKMKSAQWIGGGLGIAIAVICLAFAMREKRESRAQAEWSYGSAVGAGVLTGLFGALFGAIFGYVYVAYINPQLCDVVYQMQVDKMEATGLSTTQIERAEPMLRKWISPAVFTVSQAVSGLIMGVLLSLIVAIFFRKPVGPAVPTPPPVPV